MSKYLVFALLIIVFITGTGVGFVLSPQYAMVAENQTTMMELGKADKQLDLRYLNAMSNHHQLAIALAEQAKTNSRRDEIRSLATTIIANEPAAIAKLYQWKQEWYRDRSKVKTTEGIQLGSYDEKFDLRFLNALIAHHEEGIEMANEVMTKSTRNEVLNNATEVAEFLTESMETLQQQRTSWYTTN